MLELKPLARWMLPWSLLAGMILTLLFLGSQTWEPSTDCAQRATPPFSLYTPRGGCGTLVEGYPVRFLASHPLLEQNPSESARTAGVTGDPVINKGGLAEDWLIWSLVSSMVLYYFSAPRGVLLHLSNADTPGLLVVPYPVVRNTGYILAGLGAVLIVLVLTALHSYNSTHHDWLGYTGWAVLAAGIWLRSLSRHRPE